MQKQPHAFRYTGKKEKSEVNSIQRLETLYRFSAKEVADMYFDWLPQFCKPWMKVERKENCISLIGWGMKKPLIVLRYNEQESQDAHQIYYIKKGYLTREQEKGRLSFRNIIDSRYTMAEIHEFSPRLPWFIYKYSQALLHLWVMRAFNRYLLKMSAKNHLLT